MDSSLPSLIITLAFGVSCLLALATTIFWIWSLIDCVTNERSDGNDRMIWLVILLLTGFIGSIIYVLVRIPARRREEEEWSDRFGGS